MLQYTSAKKRMLEEREQHLDILLTVANYYKNATTKEDKKFYMDYMMWLGEISKKIKDELDQNDYSRYMYVEEMDRKIKEWNEVSYRSLEEEIEYIKRFPKLYSTFSRKDLYPEEYFTGKKKWTPNLTSNDDCVV